MPWWKKLLIIVLSLVIGVTVFWGVVGVAGAATGLSASMWAIATLAFVVIVALLIPRRS